MHTALGHKSQVNNIVLPAARQAGMRQTQASHGGHVAVVFPGHAAHTLTLLHRSSDRRSSSLPWTHTFHTLECHLAPCPTAHLMSGRPMTCSASSTSSSCAPASPTLPTHPIAPRESAKLPPLPLLALVWCGAAAARPGARAENRCCSCGPCCSNSCNSRPGVAIRMSGQVRSADRLEGMLPPPCTN